MRHKRDFARITKAWKEAKTQADINTSAEALQKRHDEPIEILPENWTSVTVLFRKKYGNDLRDEELPSQYAQGRAAGSRDRHGRSGRTRKSEARSDKAVWNYNLIPNSRSKLAGPERARPPEERGTASQVRGREQHVAAGSALAARTVAVLRPPTADLAQILGAAAREDFSVKERAPREVLGTTLGTVHVLRVRAETRSLHAVHGS